MQVQKCERIVLTCVVDMVHRLQDIRSLAGQISKLENSHLRYGYSFAIMQQKFIDKIKNDVCNYEKLLFIALSRYSPRVGPQATSSMIFVQSASIPVANAVVFRASKLLLMKIVWERKLLVLLPFRTDKVCWEESAFKNLHSKIFESGHC